MVESLILAAGYGKRSGIHAGLNSKGLLPVAGCPAIAYGYDQLVKSKYVNKISIITNLMFENEYSQFINEHYSPKTVLLTETVSTPENILGSVATLDYFLQTQGIPDDLMLLACDNVFDFHLDDLIEKYKRSEGNLFGMYRLPLEETKNHGVITLVGDQVNCYVEKPEIPFSDLIVTYCILLNGKTLKRVYPWLSNGGNPDGMGKFIASTIRDIPLFAFRVKGKWFDIGSEKGYTEANQYFNKKLEGKKQEGL